MSGIANNVYFTTIQCFALFLVLALGYANATEAPELEVSDRIFDGFDGEIIQFPYQVGLRSIKRKNGVDTARSTCGGSIISAIFILTASHCVSHDHTFDPVKADDISVHVNHSSLVLQNNQGEKVPHVKNILLHPHYANTPDGAVSKCTEINIDLAVLELTNPLPLGPGIQVIPLAKVNTILPAGTQATISGYGLTESETQNKRFKLLYAAEVPIVTGSDCTECFRTSLEHSPDAKICAGLRVEGAPGDSGGPLVVNGVLEGIISCGSETRTSAHCPNLFTRIASNEVRSFIKNVTGI